jgi:hypothetical protein
MGVIFLAALAESAALAIYRIERQSAQLRN